MFNKPGILIIATALLLGNASCSDKNDEPDDRFITTTIGFSEATFSGAMPYNKFGTNLYYGAQGQITFGWIANVGNGTYAQFPVNYGHTFNSSSNFELVWGYSFFNGGMALSKYHDMLDATDNNQLSVYSNESPSGGNFVVSYGVSDVTNPSDATYPDYDPCGRVYLTNINGYNPTEPGQPDSYIYGTRRFGYFKSVWVNNTTYTYYAMKNGNNYASALNEENKGWFKVQFIAFYNDKDFARPVGYVEQYLANFDPSLNGGKTGIVEDWIKVDLSSLPEAAFLIVNFVGSDMGEYGLNTPAYCALDNFEIAVENNQDLNNDDF